MKTAVSPFERLPHSPFFPTLSTPYPPECKPPAPPALLTWMTGFFETTAPTESLPLDMVAIKAIITQQGAKRNNSDQVGSYFFTPFAPFLSVSNHVAFLKSPESLSAGHGRHQSNDHRGTEVKDCDLFRSYFVYSNTYLGSYFGITALTFSTLT
ncbi:hypothetical protein V8E54_006984 [Elaphomyces granulatus]